MTDQFKLHSKFSSELKFHHALRPLVRTWRIPLLSVLSVGFALGVTGGCSVLLDFTPDPSECWCGEQWRAQISGASAFGQGDQVAQIAASTTSATRCVSMLEHLALDGADPQDPVYLALREALRSEAIAKCELAGAQLLPGDFTHTDCAQADLSPVSSNCYQARLMRARRSRSVLAITQDPNPLCQQG